MAQSPIPQEAPQGAPAQASPAPGGEPGGAPGGKIGSAMSQAHSALGMLAELFAAANQGALAEKAGALKAALETLIEDGGEGEAPAPKGAGPVAMNAGGAETRPVL